MERAGAGGAEAGLQQRRPSTIALAHSTGTLKPGVKQSARPRHSSGSGHGGGHSGGYVSGQRSDYGGGVFGSCAVSSRQANDGSWPLMSFAALLDNPELQAFSERPRVAVAHRGPIPSLSRATQTPQLDPVDLIEMVAARHADRSAKDAANDSQECLQLKAKPK